MARTGSSRLGASRLDESKLDRTAAMKSRSTQWTLFDRSNVGELASNAAVKASPAAAYITALVGEGPRTYVDNADLEMRAGVLDGTVLPLVLGSRSRGITDVGSPYSHYLRYTREEFGKRNRPVKVAMAAALFAVLAVVLRLGRIDSVTYANNWLWSTNPSPALDRAQLQGLTQQLANSLRDRAIVFRTVNPTLEPDFARDLAECGYQLVRSRRVYVLNVRRVDPLQRSNNQMDRQLIKRWGYEVVTDPKLLAPQAARLTELYRGLYIDKHSRLNPQFNENFIRLTLDTGIMQYQALEKGGRIDAFVSHFSDSRVLTGALIGYDRNLPAKLGLYRQAVALLLAEAMKQRKILNVSAGADSFKMLRGFSPVEEYDAVYPRHLPPYRRWSWDLLRLVAGVWAHLRK